MPLTDYSPCPCGSGKKFKWCCLPIGNQIAKALQQDEQGQHEAALRMMDELVAQHPDNPEVWGKKALVDISLALTTSRLYPTVKYALGHGKASSRRGTNRV